MVPYQKLKDVVTHKRFKHIIVTMVTFSLVFLLFSLLREDEEQVFDGTKKGSPVFEAFYNCVYPKFEPLKGNYDKFWTSFVNLTKECDDLPEYDALNIQPLANKDEIKYVAFPKNPETNMTMVTLGIGHDVEAEIALKKIWPKTQFYGADPSADVNKDLYENKLGGSYFQVAVSGEGGMHTSLVLWERYRGEATMHIGADYFFGDMLQKPRVDILWIDIEQNEYPLLDMLHRGGSIENKGVKICQMNIELHKDLMKGVTGEKEMFHEFVWKILADKKYIMVKPFYVYWYKQFIRTVIINVDDPECTNVYMN